MTRSAAEAMDYDESSVLRKYVWDACQHVLTDLERRAERAVIARAKAAGARKFNRPDTAQMLDEKWGCVADPEVDAALAAGEEAFRQRVCERVLADPMASQSINRCPRCNRVVRTPTAQQCFWCGHDWHGQ